jgi:hypothetical protein
MKTSEAMNLAGRVISSAIVESGHTYWLCVNGRTIVYYPSVEIPASAFKIFEFNLTMARKGLSSKEWDRLESKLKFLCERKLL